MSVNKNLVDLFQARMFDSSLGNSLSLERAYLYMGFFFDIGDVSWAVCSCLAVLSQCEGLYVQCAVHNFGSISSYSC